jgi:RNA polymerase sigma factor (sigma-70 family)
MSMDRPPFQALIDRHGTDVYRFLFSAVGAIEADDCWQETFLAALRAYPDLRDARNLKGWLMTIAHNKALDAHRSNGRRPRPVDNVPDRPAPAGAGDSAEIWDAVRALAPKQRDAILLRYGADLEYVRIGEILGCSPAAARRSVATGIQNMRRGKT